MVKTTINLDDEIHSEMYGSIRNMSKIIKQRFRNRKSDARKGEKRIVFSGREDLATLDADKEIRKGWKRGSK